MELNVTEESNTKMISNMIRLAMKCEVSWTVLESFLAHWATNFQTLNLRVKNPMSPNLKPMFLFDR